MKKEELIQEARKRGYKTGTRFNPLNRDGSSDTVVIKMETDDLSYDPTEGSLDYGARRIYVDGVWAKILA